VNLAHLIHFFPELGGVITVAPPSGPWIVVAMDAYSAGPGTAMDAWDADVQIVMDDYSAGAVAIDG
jgi:hypothetical protein